MRQCLRMTLSYIFKVMRVSFKITTIMKFICSNYFCVFSINLCSVVLVLRHLNISNCFIRNEDIDPQEIYLITKNTNGMNISTKMYKVQSHSDVVRVKTT